MSSNRASAASRSRLPSPCKSDPKPRTIPIPPPCFPWPSLPSGTLKVRIDTDLVDSGGSFTVDQSILVPVTEYSTYYLYYKIIYLPRATIGTQLILAKPPTVFHMHTMLQTDINYTQATSAQYGWVQCVYPLFDIINWSFGGFPRVPVHYELPLIA